MSEAELEQRLYNVIENAQRALDLSPAHKQPPAAPTPQKKALAQVILQENQPQPLPAVIPVPIAAEQVEEEIYATRLFIGLDIKELNSNGQPIRWQTPINSMVSRINNAKFEPNDYFHITIAWYETKKAIDPAMIAKVERALAHAAEILKIVFPTGVYNISLLDSAVLLGVSKSTVAFRVAESTDLKKLQDILLKFLSFEQIEGFKFSTFAKETPIHVTLGKILPQKMGPQFQNIAATLSAPDGARTSQGQSFTINTFRLTYSVAGKPWQEKMSYKF